ncbi:hypothetical protein NDU88_006220 [Pleurodeles waltl]|uniref:Uncharacterized protein n=1 Tax=Pleurodeles waltl TaxID=8319 RepID=A0AAV7MGW8_PLEWA|nr:hypothetical protein NDU88_006220 [Pleurodeles waltl]
MDTTRLALCLNNRLPTGSISIPQEHHPRSDLNPFPNHQKMKVAKSPKNEAKVGHEKNICTLSVSHPTAMTNGTMSPAPFLKL